MGEKQKLSVRTEKLGVYHRWGSHWGFFLMVPKSRNRDFVALQLCQMWGPASALSHTRDSCQDLSLWGVLQRGKQK